MNLDSSPYWQHCRHLIFRWHLTVEKKRNAKCGFHFVGLYLFLITKRRVCVCVCVGMGFWEGCDVMGSVAPSALGGPRDRYDCWFIYMQWDEMERWRGEGGKKSRSERDKSIYFIRRPRYFVVLICVSFFGGYPAWLYSSLPFLMARSRCSSRGTKKRGSFALPIANVPWLCWHHFTCAISRFREVGRLE